MNVHVFAQSKFIFTEKLTDEHLGGLVVLAAFVVFGAFVVKTVVPSK